MRPKHIIMAAVAATFALGITGQAAAQQTTLNVATAGSQNMVDYVTDYLGPMFEKANPGVKVRTVASVWASVNCPRWENIVLYPRSPDMVP